LHGVPVLNSLVLLLGMGEKGSECRERAARASAAILPLVDATVAAADAAHLPAALLMFLHKALGNRGLLYLRMRTLDGAFR